MSTGSRAAAMAVFISTPSQPSSIAMAASDAVPTPASTSTGTFTLVDDELQVPRIEDAHARADERGERHDRDAADGLQHLRLDRVVGAVHHHLEAFLDQRLGRRSVSGMFG